MKQKFYGIEYYYIVVLIIIGLIVLAGKLKIGTKDAFYRQMYDQGADATEEVVNIIPGVNKDPAN